MKKMEEETVLGGRFKLLNRIARGRVGDVFLAVRTDLVGAPKVAVKVLRDERFKNILASEALALLSLCNEPDVPRVFEINLSHKPAYVVMPFICGITLRDVLRQTGDGRLPWRTAARIAAKILRAVAAAHSAGLVHADIKPENVMIETGCEGEIGADPRICVIDFAGKPCSRKCLPDDEKSNSLVLDDDTLAVVGSLRYLPHEFDRSADYVPAPAGDVYSVGLVLSEMLCGSTVLKFPIAGVPRWLSSFVERATSIKPADRFADADEMLSHLNNKIQPRPEGVRALFLAMLAAAVGGLIVMYLAASCFDFIIPTVTPFRGEARNVAETQIAGTLAVSSFPSGARIIVDGRDACKTTPVVLTGLSPTHHEIILKKDGYFPEVRNVNLASDSAQKLAADLRREVK